MKKDKIVAVIPVRTGSSRIKDKNFQPFSSHETLIHQKVDHLINSGCFDEIYISSNNERVKNIAEETNVRYIERDDYFCGPEARWDEVIVHILESIDGKPHVGWAMVTSPLFKRYHEAVDEYLKGLDEGYDSLIGVKEVNEYLIDEKGRPLFYGFGPWHLYTTEFNKMFAISDTIFIAPKELQMTFRYWFGRKPKLFMCNQKESIDVNFPDDLITAKVYAKIGDN